MYGWETNNFFVEINMKLKANILSFFLLVVWPGSKFLATNNFYSRLMYTLIPCPLLNPLLLSISITNNHPNVLLSSASDATLMSLTLSVLFLYWDHSAFWWKGIEKLGNSREKPSFRWWQGKPVSSLMNEINV